MKLSELKNGAVVETRNGERYLKVDNTLINLKDFCGYNELDSYNDDLSCKATNEKEWDIVKVNNNVKNCRGYLNGALLEVACNEWTWERPKTPILDNIEKEYLKTVCRPYDVIYITKEVGIGGCSEFICIYIKSEHFSGGNECISLPYFSKNTMYKGMKLYEEYTLEELGIK